VTNRPKLAGMLKLNLRERKETAPGSNQHKAVERSVEWEVAKTQIIVCDMWDEPLLQVGGPARRRHGTAHDVV